MALRYFPMKCISFLFQLPLHLCIDYLGLYCTCVVFCKIILSGLYSSAKSLIVLVCSRKWQECSYLEGVKTTTHSDEWNYDLEYINIPNWTKCINLPSSLFLGINGLKAIHLLQSDGLSNHRLWTCQLQWLAWKPKISPFHLWISLYLLHCNQAYIIGMMPKSDALAQFVRPVLVLMGILCPWNKPGFKPWLISAGTVQGDLFWHHTYKVTLSPFPKHWIYFC